MSLVNTLRFVAFLLMMSSSAQCAILFVDPVTAIDEDDGACSLLEALENAEQDAVIHRDCPSGARADRLVLTDNHDYVLESAWPGTLSGTPVLTDDLEIYGREAVIQRDPSAPVFRLFEIDGATVVMNDLTLRGGVSANLMLGAGGILVSNGDLTVRNAVLEDNDALQNFAFGGAIRMDNSNVLIEDSVLRGNVAISTNPEHGGAAIAQFDGELTIRRSALLDNWADVPCTPSSPDSVASTGGALRVEAAAATGAQTNIYDSTLADNIARVGGAIHLVAIADTGVTGIQDVFVLVMRSTVVYNEAVGCGSLPGLGDGIHVQEANGGDGLVAFGNTILHGNGRSFMGDVIGIDCSSSSPSAGFVSLEGGLIDPDDQCPSSGFDALETDISTIVNPVRNDMHYAPLASGLAVDLPEAGVNCASEPDQLSNPRAGGPGQGGDLCDAGAIEFQPIGFVFTLDVTVSGSGTGSVSSTPVGIDCPGTCSADFDDGTVVEITATPEVGHSFAGWSGACSGFGTCIVTMNQARSVTAAFDEPSSYPLNVVVLGGDANVISDPVGIDCPGTCSADFPTGSTVELIQTPAPGFGFDSWGGSCSGDESCVLTMDQERGVSANYAALNTLMVTVDGAGTVTSTPAGIDCPGTCSAGFLPAGKVLLDPQSIGGSIFTGWSGDCSGTGICLVSMDQQRAVTANFTTPGFTLTVMLNGEGAGSVTDDQGFIDCPGNCSALVPSGTMLTLTATAETGSSFQGFAGDCQGATCSITLDADRSVTATLLSADQLFLDSFE